ncbi:hypothetical protein [Actinocrispum wychmicini]|uniref:hypothetical protein n=1 Tax=Actinocrispum wychmicini TaxID=1213861 RepID=UPI00104B614E|nr:hypothetical protein [Actinocrispum wychmicini]
MAFAAWTTDATGSVSRKAGSVQNLTIVAAPDPKADLFPGKTGAAQFTITNPNPFDLTITSITFGTATTSAADCVPSNIGSSSGAGGAVAAHGQAAVAGDDLDAGADWAISRSRRA